MQQGRSRHWIGAPSPAMVVAVIALIVALTGTAWAALVLPKNSVGTRQLKAKAVTTGKIANNAVNGAKVLNGSLSGADINLAVLGEVPKAKEAGRATNADTLGAESHSASCPAATTLIRGICFDSSSSGPVANVRLAADACAEKGGYLPTPMELYSTRNVLNLGEGVPPDYQYTDAYYSDTNGGKYRTIVIDGKGTVRELEVDSAAHYTCAYPLVR